MFKDQPSLKISDDLSLKCKELLSISTFNINVSEYIKKVMDTNERIILTKNGVPVAGLVPLWMLAIVEASGQIGNINQSTIVSNTQSPAERTV